nr:hypothetical protein [Musicola paradisiaca]
MNKAITLKMLPPIGFHLPARSLMPLALPLTLLLLWSLASLRGWMPPQILPAPQQVVATAVSLLQGDLPSHLLISLQRLGGGLLAGVLAGTLLGALMGASRRAEQLLYPTVYTLAQIPTLGWIPFSWCCSALMTG